MVSYDGVTLAIASFMRVAEKVFHPSAVNQPEHSENLSVREDKSQHTTSDIADEKTSGRAASRPIARMPIHPSMRGNDPSSLPEVWRTDKGDPGAYSAHFMPWVDQQGTLIEKYRDENGARRA